MTRIGSRGINEDLVLLARSGCHQGPEAGHDWCPALDDRTTGPLAERLDMIQPDGMSWPLLEDFWAFSPHCRDCWKAAKEWFVGTMLLTSSEWERLARVFNKTTEGRVWGESEQRASRYGVRPNGEYGYVDETELAAAVSLDDPTAHVGRPRVRKEELAEWKASA